MFGLNKATHAILYFDKTRKMIGIQPINNQKETGTFRMSRRRRSISLKAPQFFEQYGLEISEPQRFDVTEDKSSKMLTVTVKDVQRRRGRRPKKTS